MSFSQKVTSLELTFQAVIDYLRPRMDENIAVLARCEVGSSSNVLAVVSSLAVAMLVKYFAIDLTIKELVALLSCLALKADPSEKKCSVYEAIVAEYSPALKQ